MENVGFIVGENNWQFAKEIYQDLCENFHISVFNRSTSAAPVLKERLNRWRLRRDLQGMLRHNRVCFFEWASDLLATATQLPKHCAIVTRLHSFELYEWAARINWTPVDKIVFVSHQMRNLFNAQYPEHAEKTLVIHNGVRMDKFFPIARCHDFTIGMLCHLVSIKRVYEVILMFHTLRKTYPGAILRIGGEPDPGESRYAVALYRLVDQLGLSRSVIFEGHVRDAAQWFHNIDVFVSNSFWEGQQVALLEAMASGCYCLSHCWAGVEEVLPAKNIYLTEGELLEKISQYFEFTQSEKHAASQHLRMIASERFDIRRTQQEIRQLIESISYPNSAVRRTV